MLEQKLLLDPCINLHRDFFSEIRSNYRYFDFKTPMHQLDIVKTIIYHKIIIIKLNDKHKAYNNKKQIISYVNFFIYHQNPKVLKPNTI